jgi:hypothetical protein
VNDPNPSFYEYSEGGIPSQKACQKLPFYIFAGGGRGSWAYLVTCDFPNINIDYLYSQIMGKTVYSRNPSTSKGKNSL